MEEDHRPDGRPAHASQPVELPLLRRHWAARVSRVVRRPEDAAGAGCLRRLFADGRSTSIPGPTSNLTCRTPWTKSNTSRGGTDTKWGAVRAKNGHPEPFKLTYVEIGNEDWFDKSGSYDGRYAQFYKAIKAKYPELQFIATAPVKGMKPDVIDDHYYLRADADLPRRDPLRQDRPQRPEDLRRRVGHARRLAYAQHRLGARRCGVDDRDGAQQRPHRHGRLRAAAG